ncbi:hypothetical protein NSE01_34670 [Novosphingobium sediminis]|uniref:Uncharacterized protein n=2 Tax=Novosphingobium sediminis TaxID=707214 RepID=A0A512APK4_9SPHN|nr:hypothetical protein NSE01_34670 [Novosphingobium sediminis]
MMLIGWVGPAFLTASALAALSITARLTWDKRRQPGYLRAMLGLIAVQMLIIMEFGPHVHRNTGAMFMFGALVEAIFMTTLLRSVL